MLCNKNEFVAELFLYVYSFFYSFHFKKMIINLYFIGFGEFTKRNWA